MSLSRSMSICFLVTVDRWFVGDRPEPVLTAACLANSSAGRARVLERWNLVAERSTPISPPTGRPTIPGHLEGAGLEHRLDPSWDLYKVRGKVFMLMTDLPGRPVVILKADPDSAVALREQYADITPATT